MAERREKKKTSFDLVRKNSLPNTNKIKRGNDGNDRTKLNVARDT